ncbi:MAG TPA: hypothetical protein VII06_09325 [Chloroflexota bacterium]|jgi:hypothetical protein
MSPSSPRPPWRTRAAAAWRSDTAFRISLGVLAFLLLVLARLWVPV